MKGNEREIKLWRGREKKRDGGATRERERVRSWERKIMLDKEREEKRAKKKGIESGIEKDTKRKI